MKKLSVIVMGCGNRGSRYIEAMMKLPDKFVVKAIAEPVKEKREYLRDLCNIPDDMCFESWEQLLELPKMADIAMVCTQDKEHFAPAMKAIEKKYDLLLENPFHQIRQNALRFLKLLPKTVLRFWFVTFYVTLLFISLSFLHHLSSPKNIIPQNEEKAQNYLDFFDSLTLFTVM